LHQALYRKWRPMTFKQVVGQEHITNVLQYEVQHSRISHAYLFCGSRGTGKTTCAKILAKAANCLSLVDGNPCCKCEACRAIDSGATTDVLEMDAASNTGVDYIRDIRDEVVYAPSMLKNRVYIIDEVHMLTDSAFNALLKTLEEPPENVIFILATTEMQKIPATILSRCQRFDFRRLPTSVISDHLKYIAGEESMQLTDEAAHLIARLSQGGMRDAISLLELCGSEGVPITKERAEEVSGTAGNELVTGAVSAIINRDSLSIFEIISHIYMSSKDIGVFWSELMSYYRDMLVVKSVSGMDPEKLRREILDITESEFETLCSLASKLRAQTIMYHGKLLEEAYVNTISRSGEDKRLCAEMTLMRLTSDTLDTSPEALASRIAALEDALASGISTATQLPKTLEKNTCERSDVPEKLQTESKTETVKKASTAAGKPVMREFNRWAEVLRGFEKSTPSAASFLSTARVLKDQDGVVHIRVKDSMAKTMIESRNALESLESLIRREDPDVKSAVIELENREDSHKTVFDEIN